MQNLGDAFLTTMIRRARSYKDLGDKTFLQLTETDLHYRANDACNSIAIIIQHVSGNMLSRWTDFLQSDGEKKWRNRDLEFGAIAYSKEQLLKLWEDGWSCYLTALANLKEADLLKTVYIRGEELLVVDAINRQLAHYPYHVGQIVYLGKLLKNDQWKTLSIAPGQSQQYNQSEGLKDPAKQFKIS